MKRTTIVTLALAAAAVAGVSSAQAASVQLGSAAGNLNISYGATNTGAYSSANPRSGVYYMSRDGHTVNNDYIQDLVQQTYFYRIGNAGAATEINTGTTPSLLISTGNLAIVKYDHAQFDLTVYYSFAGTQPGVFGSSMTRTAVIKNKTGSPLNLSLWSYTDMTLTGTSAVLPTPGNSYVDNNIEPSVSMTTPNGFEFANVNGTASVDQYDTYGSANNTKISKFTNKFLSTPSAVEAGDAATLLGKLTGAAPNLSQTAGQVGGQNGDGTAQNVAYAAQWDYTIAAGASKYANEQVAGVPEPATFGLLALGAGVIAFSRRRA